MTGSIGFFNWLPIFHISCDELFGAYSPSHPIRFSAISISVGRSKLYIFTIKSKKLRLWHNLRFNDACPLSDRNEVDQKADAFFRVIQSQTPEELAIQYEYLKEAFNNNEDSKSSLETRVSAHITTYFALLGLYGYIVTLMLHESGSMVVISWLALLVGFIFLAAAAAFMWSILQVKGVTRSAFKDLRQSPDLMTQARLAYTNWYASKDETRVRASLVKNAESNLILSLCVGVILWAFVQFGVVGTDDRVDTASLEFAQQVIRADGSLDIASTKNLVRKVDVDSKISLAVISSPGENKKRDRIVDFLRLLTDESRVEDLRVRSVELSDKRVIVATKVKK